MLQGTNATQITTINAQKEIDDMYKTCNQIIILIIHRAWGNFIINY